MYDFMSVSTFRGKTKTFVNSTKPTKQQNSR